ncbi:N-acetylmuramoyl-L-alanine amidase [Streptomyces sp. NPDC048566]|uniref:N-acetylmuramoyl-L-alanine amidase n=1 Tax=Streptomyces sp. NPDC048566 TaxID=3365569 RepID=UPI003712CFF5
MATPMTAAQFAAALRAEGVTVVEVGNWADHNRNHKGSWGPVNGVMIHHTVSEGTGNTVAYCRDGDSALPGPLCHGVIDKQGVVHLVGYGRANHAGGGDSHVLAAVVAEDYGDRPPATHEHQGSAGAVDGNPHFYGFECVNLGDGKDPWPDAQTEAIERVSAAICRHHGWTARSVIGHLEWSDWKSDPRGWSMTGMRERIAGRLGHPTTATPAPAPVPARPTVSLAHVVYAARHDPAAAQGHTTHKAEVLLVEKALKSEGLLATRWVDGSFGTKTVTAYAAWQRRLGYSGPAADGIPGIASLRRLGAGHGFDVKE